MRVKVAEGHRVYFEGADRTAGDVIDIRDKVGRVLIKMGKVVPAGDDRPLRVAEPEPARRSRRRDARSGQESMLGDGARYDRRDMRSED